MCCPREHPADKTCRACGRTITWRKKWSRCWDQVRYCSSACRRSKARAFDASLEDAILGLLSRRARNATMCPSEAARMVAPEHWRELMAPARSAARRLVDRGEIEILQRGKSVDPSTARGAIRLRRRQLPASGG